MGMKQNLLHQHCGHVSQIRNRKPAHSTHRFAVTGLQLNTAHKFTQRIKHMSGCQCGSPGVLYSNPRGVQTGFPAVKTTMNNMFYQTIFNVECLPPLSSWYHQKRTFFTSRSLLDPSSQKTSKNVKLWQDEEEKSKVEEAVEAMKRKKEKLKEKAFQMECSPEEVEPMVAVAATPKKTIWERVKHEAVHYYNGFKLLYLEIKIAARMLWQVMNGKMLSRRERRQVSY